MNANSKACGCSGSFGRQPREKHSRTAAVAATVLLLSLHGSDVASASDGSMSRQIADGRPWQMRAEDGRTTKLVLYPDGTGEMTGGVMNFSPEWRATSDGLCLKPAALIREQCVVLYPTSKGFIGTRHGATVFTLER